MTLPGPSPAAAPVTPAAPVKRPAAQPAAAVPTAPGAKTPAKTGRNSLDVAGQAGKQAPAKAGPAAKPGPPPKSYGIDAKGYLVVAGGDADGRRVGWAGSKPSFVCVTKTGEEGVSFDDADVGKVVPGGRLLGTREIVVTRSPDADPKAPGPVTIASVDPVLAVRFDAGSQKFCEPVLFKGRGWTPIRYERMDDGLKTLLRSVPEAHIVLADGSFWALMDFKLRGEGPKDPARIGWIASKDDDVQRMEKRLATEKAKLPTADLIAQVDEYTKIIIGVMAHEGSFDATGGSDDPEASIGIFQWGMAKHSKNQAGSSMLMFFKELKGLAKLPEGAPETPEHKLYAAAWAQVRSHGIDVDDKKDVITVNGVTAEGHQIEELLVDRKDPEMAKGALRTYQLAAARSWVEWFKNNAVRPGPVHKGRVGHKYQDYPSPLPGRRVMIEDVTGRGTFEYMLDAPADAATVGSVFPTEKNLALVVSLGANRPHWVEATIWAELVGDRDFNAEVEGHLKAIRAAAIAAKARGGTRPVTLADAQAWGAEDAYLAILRIIWPAAPAHDAAEEERMALRFKQTNIARYPHDQAIAFERWRRFATVESVYAR